MSTTVAGSRLLDEFDERLQQEIKTLEARREEILEQARGVTDEIRTLKRLNTALHPSTNGAAKKKKDGPAKLYEWRQETRDEVLAAIKKTVKDGEFTSVDLKGKLPIKDSGISLALTTLRSEEPPSIRLVGKRGTANVYRVIT